MAINYKTAIVNSALSYLGTTAPKGDDRFIKAYNKWAGSKFDVDKTPWCAIFVTYNARMVGVPTSIIPNFASCSVAIKWFETRGRYHTRDSGYTPKSGDLIFFDWKPGTGVDHVGIVIDSVNGRVETVEGNTRNSNAGNYGVFKKSYVTSSNSILGYAEPDYTNLTAGGIAGGPITLSSLVKGTYIKTFQTWMSKNYPKIPMSLTGDFDKTTQRGVIKCWQTQMNISYRAGIVVDGIFGPVSKAATLKRNIKKGTNAKNLVHILQGLLYAHGYDPKGFNGTYSVDTVAAVQAFQKARKLPVTGEVDGSTWYSLFNKW